MERTKVTDMRIRRHAMHNDMVIISFQLGERVVYDEIRLEQLLTRRYSGQQLSKGLTSEQIRQAVDAYSHGLREKFVYLDKWIAEANRWQDQRERAGKKVRIEKVYLLPKAIRVTYSVDGQMLETRITFMADTMILRWLNAGGFSDYGKAQIWKMVDEEISGRAVAEEGWRKQALQFVKELPDEVHPDDLLFEGAGFERIGEGAQRMFQEADPSFQLSRAVRMLPHT